MRRYTIESHVDCKPETRGSHGLQAQGSLCDFPWAAIENVVLSYGAADGSHSDTRGLGALQPLLDWTGWLEGIVAICRARQNVVFSFVLE